VSNTPPISATEELARLQLKQIRDKERSQKNGCIGCLGVIVIIVVGSFMTSTCSTTHSVSAGNNLNEVSRFAQKAHLLLEADAAASTDIPQEAATGNYAQAYDDADRAA